MCVYKRLYKRYYIFVFSRFFEFSLLTNLYSIRVEIRIENFFNNFEFDLKISVKLHVSVTKIQQLFWTRMKIYRTCLYCLKRKFEHVFTCDHTICNICLKIFEHNIENKNLHFKIFQCFLCSKQNVVIAKIKFAIVDTKILNINENDIRNVILLKFFNLL